jgi:hypothetical protein
VALLKAFLSRYLFKSLAGTTDIGDLVVVLAPLLNKPNAKVFHLTPHVASEEDKSSLSGHSTMPLGVQ